MWQGKGVTFKHVRPSCKATFQVVYIDSVMPTPSTSTNPPGPTLLASSFFPNTGPAEDRTLRIYLTALFEHRVKYIANILAHELGHILGLRHEFPELLGSRSVLWGKPNDDSVMNYHVKLRKCRVRTRDLVDLQSFYASRKAKHQGLSVHEIEPPLVRYD